VLFVLSGVLASAGCGGDEGSDEGLVGSTTTGVRASASTVERVTAPASVVVGGRLEGVAVASGQTMVPPYPWWWVVDLAGAVTIDGSSRVAVEVGQDELGCGDERHPIDSFQVAEGDAVSFELADGDPGARPEFWMPPGGDTYTDVPAVRARQFRVDCPAGTVDGASALAAARARWEQAGPSSYEFVMTWQIFNDTHGDYRIAVADGMPLSIERSDGTRLDPARVEGDLPRTIDELFDALTREISADSFAATYDPRLGYPTSVTVDKMLDAVDDELTVRVSELTPGPVTPPPTVAPPIGQRIDATTVDWYPEPRDGTSFWLVVDATGGVTVEGSSRLTVRIPVDEVRCGPDEQPVDSLDTMQGVDSVSFELVDVHGGPVPIDTPMWNAGPAVSGRQLHIPTCPP
jgi:hypothetical protein